MKSWLKYLALGLVAYLIFLIVSFPASQAYFLVENTLNEKKIPIKMYTISGSVWSGKVSRVTYNGKPFNNLVWEVLPWRIFTGQLAVAVKYNNRDSSAQFVAVRNLMGSTSLRNVRANMSAQEILSLAQIPAVKLGGHFTLNLAQLNLDSVKGRLVWSGAESMFPQKLVLGDLFADMSTANDGTINVKLGDGGGPLQLSGKLTLTPDGRYDLSTQMSSREGRQSFLGQSLGFVGRYNRQGKVEFKRSGKLSEFNFLVK